LAPGSESVLGAVIDTARLRKKAVKIMNNEGGAFLEQRIKHMFHLAKF